ncbi:MAG: HAD phosphatase, family IIIA [Lachnoclostridium sp.]|jgi:uncharacterized protein
MLQMFYPDECADSAYDVDYDVLYRQGFRGLLFDIDNTLVEHGADADARAINLMTRLKQMGFRICLISNNSEERVRRFNKDIQVNYIYKANKPAVKNYLYALDLMNTDKSNTVFIGDQLFTDIYGAKRAGIKSFFVKPIGPEKEIQIILKRYLERIVLFFYRREKQKNQAAKQK